MADFVLKTSVSELNRSLTCIQEILSDKTTSEELRNLIVWVRGKTVKVVGKNIYICCISDIEAQVSEEVNSEEGVFFTVRAAELKKVLDAYNSLKRTKVTDITFTFTDKYIGVDIDEEPVSDDILYAEKYYKTSHFTLSKPRSVSELIKKEILLSDTVPDGVQIAKQDVLPYFNALLPTIKEVRDNISTRMSFVGDKVYSSPSSFVAVMENNISERHVFSDFVLSVTVANFIKSFFELSDIVVFAKKVEDESITLSLENDYAKAIVRALPTKKAFNLANYTELPRQGVVIDKMYLLDILKRISIAQETITLTIEPDEDVKISTPKGSATIPVLKSNFNDDFDYCSITINPDMFSTLVFSHIQFGDLLFIYFDKVNDMWEFSITDDAMNEDGKHIWYTKSKYKQQPKR